MCVCVCVCVCVSNCVRSENFKRNGLNSSATEKKFGTIYYAVFDALPEDYKTAFFCQQETTSAHTSNSSIFCLQSGK